MNANAVGRNPNAVSRVVAGEVANLRAMGESMRCAGALPDEERAAAMRQVLLAFSKDGKARGVLEDLFRSLDLSF